MGQTIPTQTRFPTAAQVPEKSIMDLFGKQAYLGNLFIATINTQSLTGTSEVPSLYISNPATSTKSLFKYLRSLNVADNSGEVIVFRVYSNPTGAVTGGSTITPVNCRPANVNTSVATVLKAPSVGSNLFGALLSVIVVGFNAQNIDSVLFICDPGQSILITAQPTAACIATAESVWWEL